MVIGKNSSQNTAAKDLEHSLFSRGIHSYYLGLSNINTSESSLDLIREVGEFGKILTDAGLLVIISLPYKDGFDIEGLRKLTSPSTITVVGLGDVDQGLKADLLVKDESELSQQVYNYLTREAVISDYVI